MNKRMSVEYPIAETFYSLKGEGVWTGMPMFFIRFAGCNLRCKFCDTDYALGKPKMMLTLEQLSEQANKTKCDRIVLTGGEPLIQNVEPILMRLGSGGEGYSIHVESNGTQEIPPHGVDWLTISPKSDLDLILEEAAYGADEIKFLAGRLDDDVMERYGSWKRYVEAFMDRFPDVYGRLLIMPIADVNSRARDSLVWENINDAIKFCLDYPQFSLTLQVHKILNIR